MAQTLSALDHRIVQALRAGPLTTRDLARKVGEKPEIVAKRCRSLKRREKRFVDLDRVDAGILRALNGNGKRTTTDLAAELGVDRNLVYRRCQRLQGRGGVVRSETRQGDRTLLFFPGTGQVLNRTNYAGVRDTVRHLREMATKYQLERGEDIPKPIKDKLRREYRVYLDALASGAEGPEREQIQAFERELMEVLDGTTLADVVGFVSFRAFRPLVRDWQLDVKAAQAASWMRKLVELEESEDGDEAELWGLLPGPPVVEDDWTPPERTARPPKEIPRERPSPGRRPARPSPSRRVPGGRRPHGSGAPAGAGPGRVSP